MMAQTAGLSSVFKAASISLAARKYSHDKYGEGRHVIVTLVNSFHGRTITTLSATGQDVFHQHFFPFTEGFIHTPANDIMRP